MRGGFFPLCESGVVIKITGVLVLLFQGDQKKSRFHSGVGCKLVLKRENKRLGKRLSTETVEGTSLSLEGVDDVECGDGLSLGVLGVGDGITDDVLEEDLEDTSGLFVDQTGDSLDTSTSSQTSNGWLGDALDVIPKDLTVTLGAAFAESFTSFSSSRHD